MVKDRDKQPLSIKLRIIDGKEEGLGVINSKTNQTTSYGYVSTISITSDNLEHHPKHYIYKNLSTDETSISWP